MSNYKTELQSNNADLQSIVNQVDELGTIVSEQDGIITQIQSALRGSDGTTADDIGVFTFVIAGGIKTQHLFIKGVTFGEWINSNMNVPFYCGDDYIKFCTANFGTNVSVDTLIDSMNWYLELTTDTTSSTIVTPDMVIEEITYYEMWE